MLDRIKKALHLGAPAAYIMALVVFTLSQQRRPKPPYDTIRDATELDRLRSDIHTVVLEIGHQNMQLRKVYQLLRYNAMLTSLALLAALAALLF